MFQILCKQSFMRKLHMLFHGNNAINFVVCNQTFTPPYAQGQNFKAPHMIMVDYAFHNLVDIQIYKLVVVYIEKKTMSKSCDYTRLPNKTLLFQLFQMHLNLKCISSNICSLKGPHLQSHQLLAKCQR